MAFQEKAGHFARFCVGGNHRMLMMMLPLLLLYFFGFPYRAVSLAALAAAASAQDAELEKSENIHIRRRLAPIPNFPPDIKTGDDGVKCWAFTHMPKSGGSTIRDLMRDKWGRDKCVKYGNAEWKYGEKKARSLLARKGRVYAGSHAEALRR